MLCITKVFFLIEPPYLMHFSVKNKSSIISLPSQRQIYCCVLGLNLLTSIILWKLNTPSKTRIEKLKVMSNSRYFWQVTLSRCSPGATWFGCAEHLRLGRMTISFLLTDSFSIHIDPSAGKFFGCNLDILIVSFLVFHFVAICMSVITSTFKIKIFLLLLP